MIVDKDGIPELIQDMKYHWDQMAFKVFYFNGLIQIFSAEDVCKSITLMQTSPKKMQWLEAQNNIEKFSLKNWRELNI